MTKTSASLPTTRQLHLLFLSIIRDYLIFISSNQSLFLLLFRCSALSTSILGAMEVSGWFIGPIMNKIIKASFDYLKDQLKWQTGMKEELERLRENHINIEDVIADAKNTQIIDPNPRLNKWIWKLRDAVDEANDVLDEFEYTKHKEQLPKTIGETKESTAFSQNPRFLIKGARQSGERAVKVDPNLKRLEEVVKKLASKAVGLEENGEKAEVRRNVNPLCGYASNPYHKCTDFCTRRNPNKKSSQKGASFILPSMSSEGRKERVMTVSTNKLNPNCSYASNPYHQCTNHCSQRTQKMTEIEQGKPGIAAIVGAGRSSRGMGGTQRNNVDPRCKYASNPYHKCSSFCSLKINQVA